MTRRTGRKEYICARCRRTIEKGEIHEVVEDPMFGYGNPTGHYNKPKRYHDKCFKLEEEEASERTQARWNEALARGEDPFKWCR